MSVLACGRYGCPNILCNPYSNEYGFICEKCFEELIHWLDQEPDLGIDEFMDSEPISIREKPLWAKKYAEKIFRDTTLLRVVFK